MFNRKQFKLDLGENLFRHKVRYETDECEPFSVTGLVLQNNMLNSITQSQELLLCGRGRFKEFRMFHDGMRWVIELQRDDLENV
jgi:hypothetical protein